MTRRCCWICTTRHLGPLRLCRTHRKQVASYGLVDDLVDETAPVLDDAEMYGVAA